MKNIKLLVTIVFFSACDQVKDELHSSGGYVGPILDDTTFKAVTYKEQVDRYYYIIASLAPAVLYSASDTEGAEDSVRHTQSAIVKLNAFNASLENCPDAQVYRTESCFEVNDGNNTVLRDIDDTAYGFEGNSLSIQRAMERLGSDVTNNIGLDFDLKNPAGSFSTVSKALRRVKDLIGPFRNFAAAYRESIHITTLSTIRLCKGVKAASTEDKSGPKCRALVKAGDDYYDKGKKPTTTLEDPEEYERTLKTLQRRTIDVIESNELGNYGFLDKEGVEAINAMIKKACLNAAKLGEDADDLKGECTEAKFELPGYEAPQPPAPEVEETGTDQDSTQTSE